MQLSNSRHSLSHILAQSIQRTLDPAVQLGTWPAIDTGFYYDVKFDEWVMCGEDQLKELTKTMQWICKEWQIFWHFVCDATNAIEFCRMIGQEFKIQLITKFIDQWITEFSFYYNTVDMQMLPRLQKTSKPEYIQLYQNVTKYVAEFHGGDESQFITFVDLCEWWHVDNTKDIAEWSFVLDKIAWAYRQWNENNPQMTRIYGLAYGTKDDLKDYQIMLEEAKKRDHRIIWQKMKLFTISQLVGSGLPLMQPNGMIIRKAIEDYLWEMHAWKWYDRVWTPHLAKEELYITSWHAEKFGDELFRVTWWDESFFMKPMNCPHHMQIFADNQFSYRDMPIRYFEPATVYRDEKTGQLSGLTRVRAITQDDWHLFCRVGQISDEVWTVVSIIKEFYTTMGMIDWYRVRLSIRWPEWKYLWSDDVREKAQWALQQACEKYELPYKIWVDEAAFYGPKLDFMFKDAIGRERQLATIQCDFNLPERFDLSFVNEDNAKERPVVIHRAISWSLERFMGVMIEHFAGNFPLWLTPEQIRIIPVASAHIEYTQTIKDMLIWAWLRAKIDHGDDSFAKKIRNAETDKVYYVLIVGDQEIADDTVSIRNVRTKEQSTSLIKDFIDQTLAQFLTRSL